MTNKPYKNSALPRPAVKIRQNPAGALTDGPSLGYNGKNGRDEDFAANFF